ncbi:MAG: hypothetical protein WCT28_02320 [Patescibacteria group bacterium]|jgi:hypothetical protein
MLDKNDIKILRGMFRENNEVFGAQHKREIRDEIYSVVKASEASLIRRMDSNAESMKKELIERMDRMKGEIVDAVIDVLDDNILPQIQELREDMVMVKHHLKLA